MTPEEARAAFLALSAKETAAKEAEQNPTTAPVTEYAQGGVWEALKRMNPVIGKVASGLSNRYTNAPESEGDRVFVDNLANSATFGAAGVVDAGTQAAGRKATSDNDEMSFMDFYHKVQGERVGREQDHQFNSIAGDVLGGATSLYGGAKQLTSQAPALAGRMSNLGQKILKPAGRALGMGVLGAAQNVGTDIGAGRIGEGGDGLGTSAAFGGLGGAGGQVLGEAIEPVSRWAASTLKPTGRVAVQEGQEAAAQSILGSAKPGEMGSVANSMDLPQGVPAQDLMQQALNADPAKTLGEAYPGMFGALNETVANPATTGMTGPIREMMTKRIGEVQVKTDELFNDFFAPMWGKNITREQLRLRQAENSDKYKALFKDNGATNVPVEPRSTLNKQVEDIFGESRTVETESLMNKLKLDIETTGNQITGHGENMTARDLLAVKHQLDGMIRLNAPTTTVDAANRAKLIDVKKLITDRLEVHVPDYKSLSGSFAETARAKEVLEDSAAMLRASDVSPEDLRIYHSSLTDAEKMVFGEGMLSKFMEDVARTGDVKALGSMIKGPTVQRAKLGIVVGDDVVDDFMTKAVEIAQGFDNANRLVASIEGKSVFGGGFSNAPAARAVDAGAFGVSAATRGAATSTWSPLRRLMAGTDDSNTVRSLFDAMSSTGVEGRVGAVEDLMSAASRQNTRAPISLSPPLAATAGAADNEQQRKSILYGQR
jgi:hypothetical protein